MAVDIKSPVVEDGAADSPLLDMFVACLKEQEGGPPPDFRRFLVDHPERARELAEFLRDQEQVDSACEPLKNAETVTDELPFKPTSFQDYEVVSNEPLGEGGQAVVLKARDVQRKQFVALKMMKQGGHACRDVERFRRDFQNMAALDHPHIVPVYGVGDHAGHAYFTMRLMEGGSLAKRKSDFCLPKLNAKTRKDGGGIYWSRPKIRERIKRIAELMIDVAGAVHYAHERLLLHRDLKPGNILLDDKGTAYVADFDWPKTSPPRTACRAPCPKRCQAPRPASPVS